MRKFLVSALGVASLMLVSFVPQTLAGDVSMHFDFDGTEYVHRWSQKGQNEFTPQKETNLNAWNDMVTVNVYDKVTNGDQLASAANSVLSNYQAAGKILKTDSKPRTETHPAEHFIAAVLGSPKFLEAVFTRLSLTDSGVGCATIYSHRVYGEKAGPQMSKWLSENAPAKEKALMAWEKRPSIRDLRELPQSTTP